MCERSGVPVTIVALSLAAGGCFGVASVLQHRAARSQDPELSMRAGLIVGLLREPAWVASNLLDGVGFVCQFLALRSGSLALVNPLLVCSLIFAVPAGALLTRRRVSRAEYLSAGVVVAGLALFMGAARPGTGLPDAPGIAWVALSCVSAAAVGCLVILASTWARPHRALLLAGAGGITWGYASAVTAVAGHALDRGLLHALASWSPYAMVASGALGVLTVQSAFQAGELRMSLPIATVSEPLVAIVIGQLMFKEHMVTRWPSSVIEVAGLAVMTLGVFALARPEVDAWQRGPGGS
jgi:drug/metabolite transporter (DMT)-like permease